MGITTLIIGFAVLAVAVIILMPMFSDSFADAQDKLDDLQKANNAGNNPKVGDTVCDLKFKIYGELDISTQNSKDLWILFPFTENNLHVWINGNIAHQPFIESSWINCHAVGGNSLVGLFGGMSLLDMALQNQVTPLDVSGVAIGDSFDIRIEGENQAGELLVDSSKRLQWTKHFQIDDGTAITIPYAFNHLFVLDNIVADNYTIKIYAEDKQLNSGGTNSFIEYKVFAP
jgi:hypothetical protein